MTRTRPSLVSKGGRRQYHEVSRCLSVRVQAHNGGVSTLALVAVLCAFMCVPFVPLNGHARPEPVSWSGHGAAAASLHGSVLRAWGNGGRAGGSVGSQGEPSVFVDVGGVVFSSRTHPWSRCVEKRGGEPHEETGGSLRN